MFYSTVTLSHINIIDAILLPGLFTSIVWKCQVQFRKIDKSEFCSILRVGRGSNNLKRKIPIIMIIAVSPGLVASAIVKERWSSVAAVVQGTVTLSF